MRSLVGSCCAMSERYKFLNIYTSLFDFQLRTEPKGKATLVVQPSAFMLSLSITSFLLLFCVLNIGSCENYNDLKNLETEFALTLYQKLAERHNRTNLVISPASISFSLGLLQFGARGNTFGQLKHALGYSIHDKNIQNLLHTAYKERINSNQSIIVHLACTLFVQAGMQLSPEFVQQAAWWGNNTVQQSNFSDPNRTKAQIREWITQNTGETSGLSLDTIESPLNQIAVVSTINFRSTWQRQFSFTHTQALSFTTPDGITLKVPTMHLRAEVNYGEFLVGSLDKISVVEIPYLEEKVSMFVVLPSNRRTSLARIETYFSAQTLSLWSSTLRRTAMDIVLPRFKIQNHLDLKWILPALGITDMFDQTEANFKGISEQGGLYISEVFHKAKIEVTEDGTRASGITAMLLLKRSRAPVFKADRPFNFILSQARTGSILFIGRLTNPTQ
ncbi:serpin E3 [Vipera latastei]